jgi:hypothetical protein
MQLPLPLKLGTGSIVYTLFKNNTLGQLGTIKISLRHQMTLLAPLELEFTYHPQLPLHSYPSRFTGRDVSAGLLESKDLSVPTIIASVYMDGTMPHVPTLLLNLINYCKTERIPLLFAADTNA